MHAFAVACTFVAGLAFCWAGWSRWRALADGRPAGDGWWWAGIAALSAGLGLAIADPAHRGFAFGCLALWAGVVTVFFAGRFLTAPSRRLLLLPPGAVAVLLAVAGLMPRDPGQPVGHWLVWTHVGLMALHLAAALTAGAAALLWLVAAGQLRAAAPRALRLPSLPTCERLAERALVVATALLLGGLATGGAAFHAARPIALGHPTVVLGVLTLALMATALGLHLAGRLRRRSLALAAVACAAASAIASLSQVLVAHG